LKLLFFGLLFIDRLFSDAQVSLRVAIVIEAGGLCINWWYTPWSVPVQGGASPDDAPFCGETAVKPSHSNY